MRSNPFDSLGVVAALARSLRPAQWTKNLFVVAPVVFGGAASDPCLALRAALAVLIFCLASGAVYLINDLSDLAEDRRHPTKRRRPIAAGELPGAVAAGAAVLLIAACLAGAAALDAAVAAWTALYLGLQLTYTWAWKRVVILDVMVIALGFVVRVLAGGAAVEVEVSGWLALCTLFLALFLAVSKRRHELAQVLGQGAEQGAAQGAEQRSVLAQYSLPFLDQMMNVVTASTLVAYALYALDSTPSNEIGIPPLLWTVPLVVFGIFRYLYLIYQKPDSRSPTEVFLVDGPFLINLALWVAVVLWGVYGLRG